MPDPQQVKHDIATPYTAAFVIFKKDHKIAFVLRANTGWMNGYFGLPSGRVEKNEPIALAARREAKEEVGVDIKAQELKHILTVHRHDSDSVWVDVVFEALAWDGELHNAEPHVHSELAWLDPDNLPDNVIPSVRFYLEQIAAGKTYAEYGWKD